MDRLSRFPQAVSEVSLASEDNNTFDTMIDEISDMARELKLTRKGHEVWNWGDFVEDSEEVDLDDIEPEAG